MSKPSPSKLRMAVALAVGVVLSVAFVRGIRGLMVAVDTRYNGEAHAHTLFLGDTWLSIGLQCALGGVACYLAQIQAAAFANAPKLVWALAGLQTAGIVLGATYDPAGLFGLPVPWIAAWLCQDSPAIARNAAMWKRRTGGKI